MNTPQIYFDHEKLVAYETGCLLVGLIRSISLERLGEELLPYRTSGQVTSKSKSRNLESRIGT